MSDYLKEGRAAARRLLEGYGDLGQGKRRRTPAAKREAVAEEPAIGAGEDGDEARPDLAEPVEDSEDAGDEAVGDDDAPERPALAVMVAIARKKPGAP